MNKKTLKVYIKQLEDKEKNAAVALAQAQHAYQNALDQQQTLQRYHQLYAQELRQKGTHGLDSRQLQHYQHFLEHIYEAMRQQVHIISQAQKNTEKALENWRQHYIKCKSIQSLLEKVEKKERSVRESVEQDLQDEFVNIHIVHKVGMDIESSDE